ncbi:MAG TPA: hypothetical protein VGN34_03605 [Ktedonobacteraceae bacterium]
MRRKTYISVLRGLVSSGNGDCGSSAWGVIGISGSGVMGISGSGVSGGTEPGVIGISGRGVWEARIGTDLRFFCASSPGFVASGSKCMTLKRDLRFRIFADFSPWILPTIRSSPLFTSHTRMILLSSFNNVFLPILYAFSKARRQAWHVMRKVDIYVFVTEGEQIQEGPG